jgi:hypothetical protein
MAQATRCLTPGAVYSTHIGSRVVTQKVTLPFELDLTEAEAEQLEATLHNQTELALATLFARRQA